MVGNAATAEDLLQETYLRVRAAASERSVEYVQPFIYQTARNLALDHLRGERRRSALIDRRPEAEEIANVAASAPTPETRTRDREMVARLEGTLARLSKRERDVFLRAKLHGWSYAEIAADLGVSKSTVQKDLTAALNACLHSYEGFNEP